MKHWCLYSIFRSHAANLIKIKKSVNPFLILSAHAHTHTYIRTLKHTWIKYFIFVFLVGCVCVCACAYIHPSRSKTKRFNVKEKRDEIDRAKENNNNEGSLLSFPCNKNGKYTVFVQQSQCKPYSRFYCFNFHIKIDNKTRDEKKFAMTSQHTMIGRDANYLFECILVSLFERASEREKKKWQSRKEQINK